MMVFCAQVKVGFWMVEKVTYKQYYFIPKLFARARNFSIHRKAKTEQLLFPIEVLKTQPNPHSSPSQPLQVPATPTPTTSSQSPTTTPTTMPATKTGPTYAAKVAEAIAALSNKKGSSLQAITASITAKHGPVNKTALSQALKKGVADGGLMKIKASYKLSPKSKAVVVKKKKVTVKKVPAKKASAAKPKKTIVKKKTSTTSTKKKTVSKAKKPAAKKATPKKTATKKKAAPKKK